MILRLILIVIVGVLIYRLFGGKFPSWRKESKEKKLEEDTLVECETCGTYVTVKESIIINGKYYCCTECTQ